MNEKIASPEKLLATLSKYYDLQRELTAIVDRERRLTCPPGGGSTALFAKFVKSRDQLRLERNRLVRHVRNAKKKLFEICAAMPQEFWDSVERNLEKAHEK
jgi:hypothetical protein